MRSDHQLIEGGGREIEHEQKNYELDFDQSSEHEEVCQNGIEKGIILVHGGTAENEVGSIENPPEVTNQTTLYYLKVS
jgi:hypothetical protein